MTGCATSSGYAPSAQPLAPSSGAGPLASATTEPTRSYGRSATAQDVSHQDPFRSDNLLIYRFDVGVRKFDSSWKPVDRPIVLGAGLTYEPEYWPLGIEAGVSYSTDDNEVDGSGYRSTNLEFTFGASKSFWPVADKLIWTFGAGAALNHTSERVSVFTPPFTTVEQSGKDWWAALYLHTRLAWMFGETFDIGLDLRGMSGQSMSTVGPVRSTENGQLLLSLGVHR